MGLLDLFKKKALDFTKELSEGVPIFRGFDPNSAFVGQRASRLAQAEVWAHGGPKSSAQGWFLLNRDKGTDLAADVVKSIIEQEHVNSVLIDACNKTQSLIRTPANAEVVYGLGFGVGEKQALHQSVSTLNPIKSWTEGIVVSQGETAQIFMKSALQAHLEGRGIPVRGVVHKFAIKDAEGVSETDVLGIFTNAEGKRQLTVAPNATNLEELSRYSVPLESAPHITVRFRGDSTAFEIHGGRTFPTLEEASRALTTAVRGQTLTSQAATSFLQRAGITGKAEAVETKALGAMADPQFQPHSYAGILLAGVLAIGGSFVMKGWKTLNASIDDNQQQQNQPHGYNVPPSHNAPLHGGPEHFSIRKTFAASPEGTTKITLDDAQLDHAAVDQSFSAHMRGGLAYGRRSS